MYFIMYYNLFLNFISMLFYCFYVCTPLPFTTSPGHSSLAIRLGLNAATSFSSLTLEVDYRGSKDVAYHTTILTLFSVTWIFVHQNIIISISLSPFLFLSCFHHFSLLLSFILSPYLFTFFFHALPFLPFPSLVFISSSHTFII